MRASILAWSAASGILLGIFADLFVAAALLLAARLLPGSVTRWAQRASPAVWAMLLLILPVLGGVLGYLEGQLKTR